MKKLVLSISLLFVMFLTSNNLFSQSKYYKEPFTDNFGVTQTEWSNFIAYGRQYGVVVPDVAGGTPSTLTIAGGVLQLRNTPNDGGGARNGYWMGRYAYNTNRFSATAYHPFGVEAIRTYAWLDYEVNSTATADLRRHCSVSMWLFQEKTTPITKVYGYGNPAGMWDTFANSIEFANEVGVWGAGDRRRVIGYYETALNSLDLVNGIRPDGRSINLTNMVNFDFQLNINNGIAQSSNVGFRMIHNGNAIQFFVNPDPDNNDAAWPNEWCYIGERQVVWNDRMQFMIGHAQQANNANSGSGNDFRQDADWDDVLVKNAVNYVGISMAPASIPVNTNVKTLVMTISNQILKQTGLTNAGVNVIKITKPSDFFWPSLPITNCIAVSNYYDDTGVKKGLLPFRYYPLVVSATNYPGVGRFGVITNGDTLTLILGDQITNMSTSGEEVVKVYMKLKATNYFTGAQFQAHVKAEQYDTMLVANKNKYSTAGWEQAVEMASGSSSIQIEKSPSYAYASVSPVESYLGLGTYNFSYYVSTADVVGRKDIKWLAIQVPSNFSNGTTVTNFSSVILGTNAKHKVVVTNGSLLGLPSIRIIKIDYTGSPIVSPGGLDVIGFSILGNNVTTGTGYFRSWSDGETVMSSSSLTNGENVNYATKSCVVVPKGPCIAYSSISPNSVFQAVQDFTFSYYLSTSGIPMGREDIASAAIEIPSEFSNATLTNFASVVLGTNAKHRISLGYLTGSATNLTKKKVILIDYGFNKIASPNGLDVISFRAMNNVTVGTAVWRSWVSGVSLSSVSSNTFTNSSFQSKAVIIVPNQPAECFASVDPALIYQGPNDYNFNYYFSTSGVLPGRESISKAAILIPQGFTNMKITNFNSVLMGTNEATLVRIVRTNLFSFPTNKKYIFLDYSTSKIASPDGLDVLSFRLIGNVEKGPWKWVSYVDGTDLSALSLKSSTNALYKSQVCTVNGETPKADSEITYPSSGDPRVFFNNITMNTVEYKIRNASTTPGNNIYHAVINVPSVFTQVQVLSAASGIALIHMPVGRIGNVSFITVHYEDSALKILPGNFDKIKFVTYHNIPGGISTNVTFTSVVNNSNGEGYMPVSTVGFVNDLRITDPQPIGACKMTPLDGVVWTSDRSNHFAYIIKNVAPTGDIYYATITLPTNMFYNISAVTSSLVSSAAIAVSTSNIFINYNFEGTNIPVGAQDEIHFTVADKYTNKTPGSYVVTSRVSNLALGNNASDLSPEETRTISFVPQPVRVHSYVSNNYVLTAITVSTLYYVFNNFGDVGNKIEYAEVDFPGGGVTITSATSAFGGSWGITGGTKINKNSYMLDGGVSDVVRLIVSDSISLETYRDLVPKVTMNTSTLIATTRPVGKTNRVFFQIPPPSARASFSPPIIFSTVTKRTESITCLLVNDGVGQNELLGMTVVLPSAIQGKVTGVNSSWSLSTITNKSGSVVVSFLQNSLDAKATNILTLAFTNTLNITTNLLFQLKVENNDGKGLYDTGTVSGGTKTIQVFGQPTAYIKTPPFIESASSTNYLVYRIDNPETGKVFLSSKVSIPIGFSVVTNPRGTWPSATYSVSNGFVWANYSVNDLDPGGFNEITLKVADVFNKTNASIPWPAAVSYSGGSYLDVAEGVSGYDLNIVFTTASADSYISPIQRLVSTNSNIFTLTVTNTGYGGNSINDVLLTYPTSPFSIYSATSVFLSPSNVIVNDGAGTITLRYDNQGGLVPGMKDEISFMLHYAISAQSSYTLSCSVDNGSGYIPTSAVSRGTKVITFVGARIDAYATPNSISSTASSNIFYYRVNNIGDANPYHKVVIKIPSLLTNISKVTSSKLGALSVTGNISSITLIYTTPLSSGDSDVIRFLAHDKFKYGSTNVSFMADASNISWTYNINTTGGQSQELAFVMPSPSAQMAVSPTEIYTTSTSNNVSCTVWNVGDGSNDIFDLVFLIPSTFSNVYSVNSTIVGAGDIKQGKIGTLTSYTLQYVPSGLLRTGMSDVVTFSLTDLVTNLNNTSKWTCFARNTSTGSFTKLAPPTGLSDITRFVKPPLVSLTPNSLDTTTSSNVVGYSINNAGAGGTSTLEGARLYFDPTLLSSVVVSGSSASSVSNFANYIQFHYNPPLDFGVADAFSLTLTDTFSNGSTNIVFPSTVNKGDGYKAAFVQGSVGILFSMPAAKGTAYITPVSIDYDTVSNDFVYVVSNRGTGTDFIDKVRINYPAGYTLLTNFIGKYFTNQSSVVKGSGYVDINYYNETSYIPAQTTETLRFRAFDSISTVGVGNWLAEVDNISGANLQATAIPVGKKQEVSNVSPDLRATAKVTPNIVYSTVETNHYFSVPVVNQSGTRKVNQIRITIPKPELKTNGMQVTSGVVGAGFITRGSNYVVVDYAGAGVPLATSGGNDTVSIRIFDTLTNTVSSNNWVVEMRHEISPVYVTATLQGAGDSYALKMAMPAASASASIKPNMLFTYETTKQFTYKVTNTGSGKNYITGMEIEVPEAFTNGMTSGSAISARPGATIGYTPATRRIFVNYAASLLGTGETDEVTINVNCNISFPVSDIVWYSYVNNGFGLVAASESIGLSRKVTAIYNPEAYITSPSYINDFTITNQLQFLILNTNASGLSIKRVKIAIPSGVYSVVTNSITTPWSGATKSVVGNEIIIDYTANNLIPGAQDTVSFKALDNISKGSNQSLWPISLQYFVNDGYYQAATNAGKQWIKIQRAVPVASASLSRNYFYLTSVSNTVTMKLTNKGSGDNTITAARILYPTSLIGVSGGNVFSSQISSDALNIACNPGEIILNYLADGTSLPPGYVDTITLRFGDLITNITTLTLRCEVNNTSPLELTSYLSASGSLLMNAVLPSDAFVTPSTLDTSTSTNTLTYRIINQGKQAAVQKAVIIFPGVVTGILSNASSKIANDVADIRLSGVSSMTLDYSSSPLLTTENDTVTIRIVDSWIKGNTNVTFSSFVDDGNGYAETITASGQSKEILFSMPNARADAYITPVVIDYDSVSNEFVYVISNKGTGSDNIDKVRISYPAGFILITNISGNFFTNDLSIVKGSGYFDINYYNETSYIPAQTTETLRFKAFDNINTASGEGSWPCQIDNMSGVNMQASTIPVGKKQTVSVVVPDQTSAGKVTPNVAYSTIETNHHFTVYVKNQSSSRTGAKIRVVLPLPQITTNGMVYSSSVLGTSNITRGSNYLDFEYGTAGLPLAQGGGADTITIKAFDTLTNTTASNNWIVSMQHTGSPSFKLTELLTPSDSFALKLALPPASASVSMIPNTIFTFETNRVVTNYLVNTGSGKNYITGFQIDVPDIFTNGMPVNAALSSRPGATAGYNALTRKITVSYSDNMLAPGESDTIAITIRHSRTNSTNIIPWNSYVDNGGGYVSTSDLSFGSRNMNILKSSARAAASISPNTIYSSDISNQFTYFLKNEGSAGDTIMRARIIPPVAVGVTGMWSITSLHAPGFITTNGTEIIVDYEAANYDFASGGNDTITFMAQDAYPSGAPALPVNYVADWIIKADFNLNRNDIVANDTGPNAQRVNIQHPPVLARAELLTPFIFTSPTNVDRTIRYKVQNKGTGANNIYRIELTLDGQYVPFLSAAVSSSPLYNSLQIVTNSSTNVSIYLDYSFAPIPAGQSCEITMNLVDFNLNDEYYNLPIVPLVRNTTSGVLSSPSELGDSTLDIIYESKTVFAPSIVQDNQADLYDATIYTINNSAEIKYQLFNKSPAFDVVEALIGFDFSKYKNVNVTSTISGVTISTLSQDGRNFIKIAYLTNTPLSKGNFDVLKMNFSYTQSLVSVTAMTCVVKFKDGTTNHFGRYNTNSQTLKLVEAPWGQVRGSVFPVLPGKSINVKLYDTVTGQPVTGVFGSTVLFTSSDTNGNFVIDYIPAGKYNVKYYDEEGQFLSDYYVKGLDITNNKVSKITQVYMKNAAVRASEPTGACRYCYDDGQKSYFCVPGETVISDFYLDIYLRDMSSDQLAKLKDNSSIKADNLSGVKVFKMELKDLSFKTINGVALKKSGEITFAIDMTNVVNLGWDVNKLSIYAWDDGLKKWVRIGGKRVGNTLFATVNYLSGTYVILPSEVTESTAIYDVTAAPNPFTPHSRNASFNSLRLSFSLDDSYENVQVNIFNLKGELIKKITEIDSTGNTVQVWWDGNDKDGYAVQGGIYIYQIRAGKNKYTGTILLAK